jgi:leucyl-tRNA synthetase
VEDDIIALHFNTAISQMMIFSNLCIKKERVTRETASAFIRLLAPFAPHLSEEIWNLLENDTSVALSHWPKYVDRYLEEDTHEYPVMINGKLRFRIVLPLDMRAEEIREKVLSHETALKWTGGADPKRFIHVPKKIINLVV